jgi:hypothetical protein
MGGDYLQYAILFQCWRFILKKIRTITLLMVMLLSACAPARKEALLDTSKGLVGVWSFSYRADKKQTVYVEFKENGSYQILANPSALSAFDKGEFSFEKSTLQILSSKRCAEAPQASYLVYQVKKVKPPKLHFVLVQDACKERSATLNDALLSRYKPLPPP